jgi:hypothetical protein
MKHDIKGKIMRTYEGLKTWFLVLGLKSFMHEPIELEKPLFYR